jgi:hypothetical protein
MINTSYSLRTSTVAQTEKAYSRPPERSHRRYVALEKAATTMLPPEHSCTQIFPDNAGDKAQRRIYGIFLRFLITQYFECKTFRGKTELQCGQSHCECENAHWAVTPTMHDDKMERVCAAVQEGDPLTPKKITYLKNRLNLSSPEKGVLQELSPNTKYSFIKKRTSNKDYHSSFHQSSFELQLSSTIQGSEITNDFDQILEKRIRKIEDSFCEEIFQHKINSMEAIKLIFKEMLAIMQTALSNLQIRREQLERFLALEKRLDQIENDHVATGDMSAMEEYAKAASELLHLKALVTTKLPFCKNFSNKKRFSTLTGRQDFFWLKAFTEAFSSLSDEEDKMTEFQLHMGKIKKEPLPQNSPALEVTKAMQEEVRSQLDGLTAMGECNLSKLPLCLFGICEEGVRREPTETELVSQLLKMTEKEESVKRKDSDTSLTKKRKTLF